MAENHDKNFSQIDQKQILDQYATNLLKDSGLARGLQNATIRFHP